MKRFGNLFPLIINFDNFLLAAKKAQRGKRFRLDVLNFNAQIESEIFQLTYELKTKTYCPGAYKTFHIYESKRRLISAAPYRDRVVHHALCNIIEPIFDQTFIDSSYANRVGYGTHRALKKFIRYARNQQYVLQCDIQKYFPHIDHDILKSLIRRKIKCLDTLWLIDLIIDNSNPQESIVTYFPGDDLLSPLIHRTGLPIGNLTSQFFANIYLNGFDHFIKENLKCRNYIRYVDDFAIFSNDKDLLKKYRLKIEHYLEKLRLKIHPIKSQISQTRHGVNFLGFRIFPDLIRIRSNSLKRARKRIKCQNQLYLNGKLSEAKFRKSLQAWQSHVSYGDTWRLQQQLFSQLDFPRD
jgi:retron-type reverse transcriptase